MKKAIVAAIFFGAAMSAHCAGKTIVKWEFPIEYSQAGLPFADAKSGILVWGGSNTLNVTVSRVDLWDHRGGYEWTEEQSYVNIRDFLQSRNEKGLNDLYKKEVAEGEVKNPYMLPLGMIRFDLGPWRLVSARLDPKTGSAVITVENDGRKESAEAAMCADTFVIRWPEGISPKGKAYSSFEFPRVRSKLEKVGFKPAEYYGDEKSGGFEWRIPEDKPVSMSYDTASGASFITSSRTSRAKPSLGDAEKMISDAKNKWRKWWRSAAKVTLPDSEVQEIYDYGMYRFGAMTDPDGIPAPLQGPWYEECQLPPWNGDYHFNINIQMCYWPAFHGNKLENLKPVFRMMKSWWPILRENARKFCKIEDGFMLPHSVDDRGTLIGGYWLGTIDHGCTAWMAHLMFRYVQYSGDIEFLKSDAYPFMKGAMNVYRAIMEEYKGRLSIAATNSPEWWGDGLPDDAWGRDASFQLAACHRLCSDLIAAAEILVEKPLPMWTDVKNRLPLYSVAPQTSCIRHSEEEIGLFDGKRLPESHRHHSHMAGIVPFDTIDFECDQKTRNHVKETYTTWIQHGPGLWSGWSMPWASMLQTRIGMSDMAVYTLKTWKKFFNNPGHGSRHNPYFPGFSLIGKHPFDPNGEGDREVMQMDGAAASVAAIQELLCHERGGVVRLFVGAPKEWKRVSFENFLVAGGFLLSAKRDNGVVTLTVRSTRPGVLRWQDPATGKIREISFDKPDCRKVL